MSSHLESEQAMLGALLLNPAAVPQVQHVQPTDLEGPHHAEILAAIRDEYEDSGNTDLVAVGARLARNGAINGHHAYLGALAQNTPSATNVARYADLVRNYARRRDLATWAQGLAERAAAPGADVQQLRRDATARLDVLVPRDEGVDLVDLAELAAREPQPPQHIIPAWLPAGEVTLFAGHGASGKSAAALHIAACIAMGWTWCGMDTQQRGVLFVSAEDPAHVLHWRLARIAAHHDVPLGSLVGKLHLLDVAGQGAELMVDAREQPMLTEAYDRLQGLMATTGAKVLVLDGVSDLYGASEIMRRHVRTFVRAVRRLVPPDGAALLLAHVDKAAARAGTGTDMYSGSTAWHNSVRARWSLVHDDDQLVLTLAKANHAKAGAEVRLRWSDEQHMHVPVQAAAEGGVVGAIRHRNEREGILRAFKACAEAGQYVPAATTGKRTAHHVLSAQSGFPQGLSGKPFWRHLEELRAMGQLREASITRKDRHSVVTLEVVSPSGAGNAGNA